jgi:uncharacterized protein
MSGFDWSSHLKLALDSTQFMALASRGEQGMWNHAVFFAYDSDVNVYFISQPESRHMQNISSNREVALAIFSTGQSPTGDVVGLQIRGQATILQDNDVPSAHKIYYQRSPAIPVIPEKLDAYMGASAAWKFVRVSPLERSATLIRAVLTNDRLSLKE